MMLPDPQTDLEIEDAAEDVVSARVVSRTASGVVVEWAGAAAAPGPVTVRWPTARGLVVVGCLLQCSDRFGRLEPTSEEMMIQRREAVRVELVVPVTTAEGRCGRTLDISVAGMRVSGRLGLELGDETELSIVLPDDPDTPFEATGRVQRVDEDGMLGIELRGLRPGQQDRLAHVVFEFQRLTLRRRTRDGSPLRVIQGGRSA